MSSPASTAARGARRPVREGRRVGQEFARVGALGRRQHPGRVAGLLDAAALHHDDPVGAIRRDAEVVGDEEHRGAVFPAQLVDQVEHAPLHRDVERAGGLVGDDERRFQRHRNGDEHPLAHAARQLVRILPRPQRGIRQADALQERDDPRRHRGAVQPRVKAQDLAHLGADRLHRVQRGAGILRDEADRGAADAVEPALRPAADVLALQPDGAGFEPAVVGQEPDYRLGGGGLAGARFADQRHDFAGVDGEGDAVDDAGPALGVAIGDRHAVEFEHGGAGPHGSALRAARLMRLADSTTSTTARPGKVVSHQAVAM